jgi:hypothetical protein
MKNNLVVLCLISCIISFGATAEVSTLRTDLFVKEIDKAIDRNDYVFIQNSINSGCQIDAYFSQKHELTIYERDNVLKIIEGCIKSANAAASVSAIRKNDLNAKLAVDVALLPETEKIKKEIEGNTSETEFMGLNWGLGFGYSFSDDEAIDDAEIVDGVVRVKSNKKDQPRVVLEFHKYLWCNDQAKNGTRGCGPFVAVAATQDDILSGVGMGFMYGFKAKPSDPEGFSIGIGAILDADIKDLADGFKENQPVPTGETAIRYKSESRWSALIFFTRTF